MGQAAGAAAAGDPRAAGAAGAEAETALAEIPEALRARRDSLVQAWREETLAALDQALSETAALARRQQQLAQALERGEGGAATRSRQVAGARSGTGFAEAVEQLARLAEAQGGLNGQAQGLLPLMGLGGQAVLEQLRALATQQRALAEQLERLQAEGASAAAGPLAEEARELARQFEAGRLDRQTIERQSPLYRRLLDAGRSLTGPEPDEHKERGSRPAIGDSVHLPGGLTAGAP